MLKLALFEILRGRQSPESWARDARENSAARWLLRGGTPSARCCYRFRDRMGDVIQEMCEAFVLKTVDEHRLETTTAAQDGTIHRACASRHTLVNEQRLRRRRELLAQMIAADEGRGEAPQDYLRSMPKTPSGRLELRDRMERAQRTLDQRLLENRQRQSSDRCDEQRVFVSLSDPDAGTGRDKENVFGPVYSTQLVVDYESSLILGFMVGTHTSDAGTLAPMIDRVQRIVGGRLRTVVADCGYLSILDLRDCRERGIDLIAPVKRENKSAKSRSKFEWDVELDTYRCPAGHLLEYKSQEKMHRSGGRVLVRRRFQCSPEHCTGCPLADGCVKDPSRGRHVSRLDGQELLDEHERRMRGDAEARAKLKLRGSIVEHSFADSKEHRGLRRLHGRGLRRAVAHIGLTVLACNILTVSRLCRAAATPCPSTG